jgi:hypothetical protein
LDDIDFSVGDRGPKKIKLMQVWRTTLGMALAIREYCAIHRITYGEFLRRVVSYFFTGTLHHDFDSSPVVIHGSGDSVFPDSEFDQQSRALHGDRRGVKA